MERQSILEDFSPFADIGTVPKISERDGKISIRIERDSRDFRVTMDRATGKFHLKVDGGQAKSYASIGALLSSDVFANLRKWADVQKDLLSRSVIPDGRIIPISARSHNGEVYSEALEVGCLMEVERPSLDSINVLLLDGPAGIGKSTLIERMALSRASEYRSSPRPLILHVKSRGRVLSNLQDLMAFSLQTIRSPITYDQVPVLVKHGVIILAIDGFDELGDPNGYELAWGQVSDLIRYIRGAGNLILAGRDTFIGRQRLLKAVRALREGVDVVSGVTLSGPSMAQAKDWLIKWDHWSEASFDNPSISSILEDGSYALRPVFLHIMAKFVKPKSLEDKREGYLTSLLMDQLATREASLFGKAVDAAVSRTALKSYVIEFAKEIAREMADSQTESLDDMTLSWVSEAALGSAYSEDVTALVKNRSSVVAYLVSDERPGYKKFIHSYLLNYFLAHVTVSAVSVGEVPKFIRRNILGQEFLFAFSEVVSQISGGENNNLKDFFARARSVVGSTGFSDRSVRNVGALLISSVPYLPDGASLYGFQVDDAVIRGTASNLNIEGVVINQLDARGADLSRVDFADCTIVRLVGDKTTRISKTFPLPAVITDESGDQLVGSEEIGSWLDVRGRAGKGDSGEGLVSGFLRNHPIYKLLGRACRYRQYWLRSEGDIHAARVLNDSQWPALADILRKHDLLREEYRQASGKSSPFVHIRSRDWILSEDMNDPAARTFFKDLEAVARC